MRTRRNYRVDSIVAREYTLYTDTEAASRWWEATSQCQPWRRGGLVLHERIAAI